MASQKIKGLGPKKSLQLSKIIGDFDRESQQCARYKAYYGACVLQGAVLEGMLIGMCDVYLDEVQVYLDGLPASQRPRGPLLRWDLDALIRVA